MKKTRPPMKKSRPPMKKSRPRMIILTHEEAYTRRKKGRCKWCKHLFLDDCLNKVLQNETQRHRDTEIFFSLRIRLCVSVPLCFKITPERLKAANEG